MIQSDVQAEAVAAELELTVVGLVVVARAAVAAVDVVHDTAGEPEGIGELRRERDTRMDHRLETEDRTLGDEELPLVWTTSAPSGVGILPTSTWTPLPTGAR